MLIGNNGQILSSLIWKLLERGGAQGIQFVVQILLARLLLPEDYGIIALIIIFIAIANVFVQNGFNTALIQKKEVDELDLSSVFYVSLLLSIVLYALLYFCAPFISFFYHEPKLIPVLRVLSFTLFFGAFNSIQNAVISRAMKFKQLFISSLSGMIASGIIGVTMAYMGFGVWALVGQQLSNNLLITGVLWITVKWRPKLIFSLTRIKVLFAFGWKLLFASLIDTIYNNVYGLIIGKAYTSQMLGYYSRGDQFPKLIVTNINGAISSVLLPAMSAHQDDPSRVKTMVRRSIVTSSFIIFPMMIGLAVCAEAIVKILLTDKWIPCVPFLQLMCISYAFWPIHTANLQAINALGRSDIFLKLEIAKKTIGIIALLISVPFGVYVMVGLQPLVSFIGTLINSYPNNKLLSYGYKEQWKDVTPSLSLSIVMGIGVYSIGYIGFSVWPTLIFQICFGVVSYIAMARFFRLECYCYLMETIKSVSRQKTSRGFIN